MSDEQTPTENPHANRPPNESPQQEGDFSDVVMRVIQKLHHSEHEQPGGDDAEPTQDEAHALSADATTLPEDTPTSIPPVGDEAESGSLVISGQTNPLKPRDVSVRKPEQTPWTLQQFFDGEIDLDVELSRRFPNMPLLSTIKFRTLGSQSGRKVAMLETQDGGASLTLDADMTTRAVQLSFSFGSMLTLRFQLDELSDMDRERWLELMHREQGGLAFLWGAARWEADYVICISRRYYTNLYAFSPNQFEAGVRLTPNVMKQVLAWLGDIWLSEPPDDEDDAPLLTW